MKIIQTKNRKRLLVTLLMVLPILLTALLADECERGATLCRVAAMIDTIDHKAQISIDSVPAIISDLEVRATQSDNELEQSLLYANLASLYQGYYQQRSYTFNQRVGIEGDLPPDISQWSGEEFLKKIYSCSMLSIKHRSVLLDIPTSACGVLLQEGEFNETLRPNLYTILAYRAISMLETVGYRYDINRYITQNLPSYDLAFAPVTTLLDSPMEKEEFQVAQSILYLYKELLQYAQDQEQEDLLVYTNLDRLAFAYKVLPESDQYLAQLKQLYSTYKERAISLAIVAQIAQTEINSSDYTTRKGLLELCQTTLQHFPNEKGGTPCITSYIERLTAPEVELHFEKQIYPKKRSEVAIRYNNIKKLGVTIYREGGENTQNPRITPKYLEQLPPVAQYTQYCSDTLTLVAQKGSLKIPKLPVGAYIIALDTHSGEEVDPIAMRFAVTRFSAIVVRRELLIVDAESGKPQPNIEVELFKRDSGGAYLQLSESKRTNREGFLSLPDDPSIKGVRPIHRGDSLAMITSIPYSYTYPNSPLVEEKISLFTDRSIYRLGQVVQYAGVIYKVSQESGAVERHKTLTLQLRDSRYQIVSTQEVLSDSYGSFSGSFALPSHLLAGRYSLVTTSGEAQISFEVAAYKRPSFQVKLSPETELHQFDREIKVNGEAISYNNIPINGATFSYTITERESIYRLGSNNLSRVVAKGSANVGEMGEFAFNFTPQRNSRSRYPDQAIYWIEVVVTSPLGETQEESLRLFVGKDPIAISLNLPTNVCRDRAIELPIKVTNLLGSPISYRGKYTLYAQNNAKEEVAQANFSSEQPASPAHWEGIPSGAYRLVVDVESSEGVRASHEYNFTLYSLCDKSPAITTPLWLAEEELTCPKGESVTLQFGSSDRNSYITYMIFEGYNLVARESVQLSNRNQLLTIPYLKNYKNDLTLLLFLVKDEEYHVRKAQIKATEPDKKLTIRSKSFRDFVTSGAKERWRFSVTDSQEQEVESRVIATMFDASLQAITPHNWFFNPHSSTQYYYIPTNWSKQVASSQLKYRKQNPITCTSPQYPILRETELPYINRNLILRSESSAVEEKDVAKTETTTIPENLRTNFAETALFYPTLTTNIEGEVWIEFELPHSNTTWQFMALAYTQDLQFGEYFRTTIAQKPLMVTPNLPRFLHNGDETSLSVGVSNRSGDKQAGNLQLELFDIDSDLTLTTLKQPFALNDGQSHTHIFHFTVDCKSPYIGVRIMANGMTASDGEQHLLRILPTQRLVTESMPLNLTSGVSSQEFTFAALKKIQPKSRTNYRMMLEYTTQPIWYVVQALPTLIESNRCLSVTDLSDALFAQSVASGIAQNNPSIASAIEMWQKGYESGEETPLVPLERDESLKSVLLASSPWSVEAKNDQEQMLQLAQLLDVNRMQAERNTSLLALKNRQRPDGSWSWFEGMPSSPYITLEVVLNLIRLQEMEMKSYNETEMQMIHKAINYLDGTLTAATPSKQLTSFDLRYLYLRSLCQDIPLADTLQNHKTQMALLAQTWSKLDLYHQPLAAITLRTYGYVKEADKIVESLYKISTYTPQQGRYWQNGQYNRVGTMGDIEVQCAMIAAFNQQNSNNPIINEMRLWLLQQKEYRDWGRSTASAEAIYTLLSTGSEWLDTPRGESQIIWGDNPIETKDITPLLGSIKHEKPGSEITPNDATVRIKRTSTLPSWGALYWQYYDDYNLIVSTQSQPIEIEKHLFVKEGNKLVPITQQEVAVGDEVVVQLVVKAHESVSFVHLQDERAACFEPSQQLAGYRYDENVGYYLEHRNAATNFYFDYLPKGNYLFTYTVHAERGGAYTNGLATINSLYAPKINAHTASNRLTVKNTPKTD